MGTVEWVVIATRVASRSPPVERSITVSAPQRSAQRSLSTSSSIELLTGLAPMFALTLVLLARPMAIGSSEVARWFLFAGITMRPAATSSRTCSAVRCGSRPATRCICGVIVPRRACSSWVEAVKPSGASHASGRALFFASRHVQSAGMKSHAVLLGSGGMPGVSGEENVAAPVGPGAIAGRLAKEPGVVTPGVFPGLPPTAGRV